jgi:hypothetical protein
VFGGSSYASRVQALDDNLTSGRTPLLLMPCQGTHGQVKQRNLADLNLDDTIRLTGLQTKQSAEQTRTKASGFEEASVARLNLGDGQLVVTAIVGRANVDRSGGHIARNAAGTRLGKVLVNGERRQFPDTDTLKIPGVAKLQRNIISRNKTGISVTALRITVLDGTGAVINLGHAEIRAHNSGL